MPSAQFTPRVVRANRRHKGDRDIRVAHHGWFYSPKLAANIPFRGTLALDFLINAEAHPSVISITNRCEPIQWWNGQDWEDYFPRYALLVRTGRRDVARTIDVEVMFTGELAEQQIKYGRIARECRSLGRQFMVFTERHCRVQPRLTNSKFILQHSGTAVAVEGDCALIRQVSAATSSFTLNDLVKIGVLPYPRAYSAALNLVGRGELWFPLGRRLDGNTVMRRRAGA